MGVLDSFIIASCVSVSGQGHDACTHALDAGTKQSGIAQNVNQYESRESKSAENWAKDFFGKTTFDILGGTAFLAKTASEKKVVFGLPTLGICSAVKADIGVDKLLLHLEWKF